MPRVIPRTMPLRRWSVGVVLALVAAACTGTGEQSTPSEHATVPISVRMWAAQFDLIRKYRVRSYLNIPSEDCELFDYGRGLFLSAPNNDLCGWIDGKPPSRRVQFDPLATLDLDDIKRSFATSGIDLRYLSIVAGPDDSVQAGSVFSGDRCDRYVYSPAWSSLPEPDKNESVVPIDGNWYKVDGCP